MLRACELSLAYWEGLARNQVGNRDFNSNLYRIAMLGRFSAEYRESKVVVEHQQPSGVDLSQLSSEQREQLACPPSGGQDAAFPSFSQRRYAGRGQTANGGFKGFCPLAFSPM
jgi:hypothetical protein